MYFKVCHFSLAIVIVLSLYIPFSRTLTQTGLIDRAHIKFLSSNFKYNSYIYLPSLL